jgi:hypothetical protein
VSTPPVPLWPSLRAAAATFSPPFEVVAENPAGLVLELETRGGGERLRLRYRSVRGLFVRTYYLVIEAELAGEGPAGAGTLVFRLRRLRWKGGKPAGGDDWRESFSSPDVLAALKRLQVESLGLSWEPERASWHLSLETLSGSVTVTFFPLLHTPNPLTREEAQAIEALLRALKRAPARIQA